MTDGHVTLADVVNAASDTLAAVEAGSLGAAEVETRAVAACRELVGQVNGAGDVLWPLHLDVARQVLEAGGLSAAELREWLAVQQRREAGPHDT
jgi:hypothetical protein